MFTPGTNCPTRPDVPGQREPGGGFSHFIDMFGHKNTVETNFEHFFITTPLMFVHVIYKLDKNRAH